MSFKQVRTISNHAAGLRELDDPGRGKAVFDCGIRDRFGIDRKHRVPLNNDPVNSEWTVST
jgi:hypothetical protein